jgi:benzoyl-CoA reductase/2-hydroxyglutaryl-CoA dehydratase subunit BcrC/BadD/HgdB
MSKDQTDGSKYLEGEITSLVSKLEQEYGVTYSERKFMESADLYRKMKNLSLELEKLTSSGAIGFGDFARIIHEEYFTPADVQVELLRSWIKNCSSLPAGENFSDDKKRVVLSGILPPPPSICDILEKSDLAVTGNDIASMYRSYGHHPKTTGDAREFYTEFYQNHFPCTTLLSTSDRRIKAIINLIRERKAHGFIFIGEKFCEYEYLEIPFLDKTLEDEGINTLHLEFSIDDNENVEAFRTRIESFAEAMKG